MSKLSSVNVRNTSRSVCLRNGSRLHEEYKKGDTLLLSCYCVDSLGCIWSRTVVGSEIGEGVPATYTFKHNNKVLEQIVIGPLTSIDIITRYYCLHGSSTKERCSIGPANVSINDSILPNILRSDHSDGCPALVNPNTGTIPEVMPYTINMSPTSTKMKVMLSQGTDGDKPVTSGTQFFVYTTIFLFILLLIALVIIILLVARQRRSHDNEDKNDVDINQTDDQIAAQSSRFNSKLADNSSYEVQEDPFNDSSSRTNTSVYYSTKIEQISSTYDELNT